MISTFILEWFPILTERHLIFPLSRINSLSYLKSQAQPETLLSGGMILGRRRSTLKLAERILSAGIFA